jgi:hypothetical protein
MKPSSNQPPSDGPERLLSARLRETTPAFEARFNELRRRLANEPRRASGLFGYGWLSWPAMAGTGAALALAVAIYLGLPRQLQPAGNGLTWEQAEAYGELTGLDEALRPALPLTDSEMLAALTLLARELDS